MILITITAEVTDEKDVLVVDDEQLEVRKVKADDGYEYWVAEEALDGSRYIEIAPVVLKGKEVNRRLAKVVG